MKQTVTISRAWRRFLYVWACFAVFTSFTSVFLSTYLIRATGGDRAVMVFNVFLGGVQPFFMLAAVFLTRRVSALVSQRVGLCLYAASFLALGVFSEAAAPWASAIAVVLAAANGFFYVPFAMQIQAYTTDRDRDRSYGLEAAITGLSGLVVPFFSGWLLSSFGDFTGYRVLFFTGLGLSVLSVILSFRLEPVFAPAGSTRVLTVAKTMVASRPIRASLWVTVCTGVHDGTMGFFANALIYTVVQNESTVGVAAALSSGAYILASLLYSRKARPEARRRLVALSLAVAIASTVPLLVSTATPLLFTFAIVYKAMSVFYLLPPLNDYFAAVGREKTLEGLSGTVHALHEFPYALGRVLGILLTMAFSGTAAGSALAVVIIFAVQLIPIRFMRTMEEGA